MLELDATTQLGDVRLDASVAVPAGECLALAGPSGAGKSSLLRVAAGLLRPERGTVRCGDRTWLDTGTGVDLPADHRRVGFLFQDYALFGHLSAWRNVAYGIAGRSRAERRERAHELLDRFGLAARAEARPATLSGGERQRVALARALAREPEVLLLDEPLSALDAATRARAGRELAALIDSAGVPVLMVTHDFGEAALLADRIAVLDRGSVVQSGSATELAAAPASAFVADLTGAVVLTGTARAQEGLTTVDLDGGGRLVSTDAGAGAVAVTVHPWEISIEAAGSGPAGSARNHLPATVTSVTTVGNRVRVGLMGSQPMVAELTGEAVAGLGLATGLGVVAAFKATATRLVPPLAPRASSSSSPALRDRRTGSPTSRRPGGGEGPRAAAARARRPDGARATRRTPGSRRRIARAGRPASAGARPGRRAGCGRRVPRVNARGDAGHRTAPGPP